jgi:chorismate mutase / prephenate dehydratase
MRQQQMSLSDLKREVDGVDDAIHDLLIRRAELADLIASEPGASEDAPQSRPARKAKILRRLAGRHTGSLPKRSLVHIWSEILAAAPGEHGTVHVFAGDGDAHYRDLARTYFGSLMAMESHNSANSVVHACADDPRAIGVVPLAGSGEEGTAWWSLLAPAGQHGPHVVARIPFIPEDGGEDVFPQAFAIGTLEQEETGDDTTLLLVETEDEVSRTRLQSLLGQAGFEAQILAAGDAQGRGFRHLLLANKGFIDPRDPQLAAFIAKAGGLILRAAPVGGYANPLDTKSRNELS